MIIESAAKEDQFLILRDDAIEDDDEETLSYNEEPDNKMFYADDEIPIEDQDYLIEESNDTIEMEQMHTTHELLSPIPSFGKSPHYTLSDCGYESHGSPCTEPIMDNLDNIELLSDLFPTLA
jgi:hypothetical protein